MNIQFLIVLLCVLAALVYLLRPWWQRVRTVAPATGAANAEAQTPSACGACKGCSGRSGGCH